jgi:hypothetical protein
MLGNGLVFGTMIKVVNLERDSISMHFPIANVVLFTLKEIYVIRFWLDFASTSSTSSAGHQEHIALGTELIYVELWALINFVEGFERHIKRVSITRIRCEGCKEKLERPKIGDCLLMLRRISPTTESLICRRKIEWTMTRCAKLSRRPEKVF